MSRILVVEDDAQIGRALAVNLRARKYEVDLAATGAAALEIAARRPPDAVLLDLGLPDMDGVAVVRGLRGWSSAPILVVSARHEGSQKVIALDEGADDYITKPFAMDELLARLRAALRRAAGAVAGHAEEASRVETADGRLVIDLAATQVLLDGAPVRLTPTEWRIVELLARNPDRLVGQRELLASVWGPGYEEERHYARVYLAQLRQKVEPDPSSPRWLRTEPGMGYRFTPGG
ncbi:Transcriptional regulatory protein KdpE [Pseudoclavibacter triregionum]|nr:Transcriptional regulatory protein KdpE [Pseudoclavibacter triregionum]